MVAGAYLRLGGAVSNIGLFSTGLGAGLVSRACCGCGCDCGAVCDMADVGGFAVPSLGASSGR